jgi:hypothetical protein
MRALIRLMALPFDMMDFSNISKRSDGLAFARLIDSIEPGSHVIVDSTGLKVYGQDEWHQQKHQVDAFDIFMTDGAYDGEPSYQQIKQKSPDATCIIPPPKNAVKGDSPERNQHIEDTQNHGRMGWQ